MTRATRGYIARRRRKKTRSFASTFRGAHLRLTRITTQQKTRALISTHRDRGRRKRDFRRLWITRINAVTRENGASHSYRRLIHDLYKRQVLLNRKILAQMALILYRTPRSTNGVFIDGLEYLFIIGRPRSVSTYDVVP